MASSPNPSGVPQTPSAVTPGLVVLAGLIACWFTDDALVLRTAATVSVMAMLIALVQITRGANAATLALSAEIRTQNREIARLRDAVNQLHQQVEGQREGVDEARQQALRVRDEAAQVREEAAALLEAADTRVTALGGDSLSTAFDPPGAFGEPMTGPRPASPWPPTDQSDEVSYAQTPDESPPSSVAQSPEPESSRQSSDRESTPPPEPSRHTVASSDTDQDVGYLEDFSINRPDDEPLPESWVAADDDSADDDDTGNFDWGFANADRGRER